MKTLIAIPCYNEASVIGATMNELLKYPFDILVVNDGSTDYTKQALAQYEVNCIDHPCNLGQGRAYITALAYAKDKGYDIIVHFDSDGQHDPKFLVSMLEPIINLEADLVLGSRFIDPKLSLAIPQSRRLLLRIARNVDYLFSGIRLSDAHNGLRALRVDKFNPTMFLGDKMEHASEIIWVANKYQLKVFEVAVKIRYFKFAHKKNQSLLQGIQVFWRMIGLKFRRRSLK